MIQKAHLTGLRKPTYFTLRTIDRLPEFAALDPEMQFAMRVVANVLPFRVNDYVAKELINWNEVPNDPMFQLTFMQRGMLSDDHFNRMAAVIRADGDAQSIKKVANEIRFELNPHPAGQMSANVPVMDEEPVQGLQHKYRETCLVFPSSGQTCHSYCTYCFRWPQFVGQAGMKFATDEARRFQSYIAAHKELTDVLITGGDPLVMKTEKLASYVEPLLGPGFEHIQSIRFGTKSVAYWPHRFVTDGDSDELLRLFDRIVAAGKHVAIMGHYNHPVELSTRVAQEAVRRIRTTGAEIRAQSPIIRGVNDSAETWAELWKTQVRMGIIPYYMFVARNTGARDYFSVPLERCWEIFQEAYRSVSGLSRTVRGPSMSCMPGKICVLGVSEVAGEKVFVLSFIQARNPEWVGRPFFAKYDPKAVWYDELTPAFGEGKFFFSDELAQQYVAPHQNGNGTAKS